MVHAHPEGLHAPAWVAYTAAGTFVLAGASVGTAALGAARLSRWLGVGVIGGLFSVTAWIAFGPGARECSMSFGVFRNLATDAVCRTAFGVGTLLLALVLALVLRRLALAPRGSPESA
jgi:hypothetical protein